MLVIFSCTPFSWEFHGWIYFFFVSYWINNGACLKHCPRFLSNSYEDFINEMNLLQLIETFVVTVSLWELRSFDLHSLRSFLRFFKPHSSGFHKFLKSFDLYFVHFVHWYCWNLDWYFCWDLDLDACVSWSYCHHHHHQFHVCWFEICYVNVVIQKLIKLIHILFGYSVKISKISTESTK